MLESLLDLVARGATVNSGHGADAPAPRGYEVRIRGRVSKSFLTVFEGLTVTVNPAETVVRGSVIDQAALFAILDRIQALGLELVEIRQLP